MKVSELIERLSQYPPNYDVVVSGEWLNIVDITTITEILRWEGDTMENTFVMLVQE